MRKLKAKELKRLKNRGKKAEDKTQKIQEEMRMSSETEDHEKQRLATLKRLKRGDEKL